LYDLTSNFCIINKKKGDFLGNIFHPCFTPLILNLLAQGERFGWFLCEKCPFVIVCHFVFEGLFVCCEFALFSAFFARIRRVPAFETRKTRVGIEESRRTTSSNDESLGRCGNFGDLDQIICGRDVMI
jgi:hypothetical protein